MAEPFLAEIRMFSFGYAPAGWALCDGQLLPVSQNTRLFALIGTAFGGNGSTTFALPDLRDRVPVCAGGTFAFAGRGGAPAIQLTLAQLPAHTHALNVTFAPPISTSPVPSLLSTVDVYAPPRTPVQMNPAALTPAGGDEAHPNMQPFLTLSFCISLTGLFPSEG